MVPQNRVFGGAGEHESNHSSGDAVHPRPRVLPLHKRGSEEPGNAIPSRRQHFRRGAAYLGVLVREGGHGAGRGGGGGKEGEGGGKAEDDRLRRHTVEEWS